MVPDAGSHREDTFVARVIMCFLDYLYSFMFIHNDQLVPMVAVAVPEASSLNEEMFCFYQPLFKLVIGHIVWPFKAP